MMLTACGDSGAALKAAPPVEKTFSEVSVHDPAIVDEGDGTYYIFGSHLAVAKTDDLQNWEYVNQGVSNESKVIPDVFHQMKDAFEWSHSNTFWAPEVRKLGDGKYHMYYCNCKGDEPLSCMGMAVADQVEGPYENQGLLLKSGMDASEKNADGEIYDGRRDPNVVDPNLFEDKEGRLWMVYGSYSGGIFVKELDKNTGEFLEPGYGKKILGGNHLRIEGPYIIYNPDTEYYYLFLSFGGLDSDGGYNVRVARSKNPDGPYLDSMGQDLIDCKGKVGTTFSDATAALFGTKLMGCYKFLWHEGEEGEDRQGYLSPGHNSVLYDKESGRFYIIYHVRFEKRGEEHEVRVHELVFNEDGWPCVLPYRYTGTDVPDAGKLDFSGTYKLIQHGRDISPDIKESVEIVLGKDGNVSQAAEGEAEEPDQAVSGSWEAVAQSVSITLGEKEYKGIFRVQWDEDGKKYVRVFSAICTETGESIWGSGLAAVQ